MKRCEICHCEAELIDGRCHSCRMAKEATDHNMSYGKYTAALDSDLQQKQKNSCNTEMINCKWCGKPFPKIGKRVYCSDRCYKAKNYETHRANILLKAGAIEPQICPKCGKEFTPSRRGHTYCSRECRPSR